MRTAWVLLESAAMEGHYLQVILVPVGIALFWALIVGPLKWMLGKVWPDSAIKRFLFKKR